jgi:alpha-L-fucosidase
MITLSPPNEKITAMNRLNFFAAILTCLFSVAALAIELPAPCGSVPGARHLAWRQREFCGFLHFTVNTFTGREWGCGDESEKVFNPADFDAGQIACTARDAGVKELVLTSDACKKYGLKFGVYLSPWDRNRADYGTPEYITHYRDQFRELLANYGPISEAGLFAEKS